MWVKTDAGRAEMQRRSLVTDRAQRNLLLLIDGHKTDAMLLACVSGTSAADFAHLHGLGLITPVVTPVTALGAASAMAPMTFPTTPPTIAPALTPTAPSAPAAPSFAPTQPTAATDFGVSAPLLLQAPATYGEFSAVLTKLIASQLGVRSLPFTLQVERASNLDDLHAMARSVIEQLQAKRGPEVAERVRRALFGG